VPSATQDVTGLLLAWGRGDSSALQKLTPLVYRELHALAHRNMLRERPGHTLQTTALVHEAYLRLIDTQHVQWRDRTHFFAMSARLMRRILVDFARSRGYQKRGGGARPVSLDENVDVAHERSADLVALDDALAALAVVDPRKSRVVEMKFFGGLTAEEIAEVLEVSPDTVLRDWSLAKSWLLRELKRGNGHDS